MRCTSLYFKDRLFLKFIAYSGKPFLGYIASLFRLFLFSVIHYSRLFFRRSTWECHLIKKRITFVTLFAVVPPATENGLVWHYLSVSYIFATM